MKPVLAFGGGVNSVALMLLLEDEGIDYEAVFVDTGCEFPETYEYLDMLRELGYRIKTIKPCVEGFDNLYDYCMYHGVVPGRKLRFCTIKFKIYPLVKYSGDRTIFVGYAWDEKKRAGKVRINKENMTFPMVERKITRAGCKQIIRNHGLPLPMKSGCYICPFMNIKTFRFLKYGHPELFDKTLKLYERCYRRTGKWLFKYPHEWFDSKYSVRYL